MSGNAKRKRRSFSDEFKHSAVELIVKQGYSFRAAADAVDVDETTLRDWHRRLAPATEPSSETATLQELTEENKRLRKLLQRAEMEREILKKATAYFAKESQ